MHPNSLVFWHVDTTKNNPFWFRQELRPHENRDLFHAQETQLPVLPLLIFDGNILNEPDDKNDMRLSVIYDEVCSIYLQLRNEDNSLLIKKGGPLEIIQLLTSEYSIENVFTNKHLNG